jgi:hypothetical protein
MVQSKTYAIQLTSEQKELFDRWLEEMERELEVRLASVKSLRRQIGEEDIEIESLEVAMTESKSTEMKSFGQSWTAKTTHALKQLEGAQTSTQIISWLMEHDADLKGKEKRYITKNVTSKLSILVDNGRLEKKVIGGKNFYSLKNQG